MMKKRGGRTKPHGRMGRHLAKSESYQYFPDILSLKYKFGYFSAF